MKYYPRILLATAVFAGWMFADFGLTSRKAAAQQPVVQPNAGGAAAGGQDGGGRNRGGRGGGRGRGGGGFEIQGTGTAGGEQAQNGNNGGGGGLFGGGRGRGRGRGGNDNSGGNGGGQQFTRGGGPGGNPGALANPTDPKELARQLFERADQNHDGMLQADEQRRVPGGAQADANHDGVITLSELETSFAGGNVTFGRGQGRGGPGGEERNQSDQPAADASQDDRGGRRGRGGRGRGDNSGDASSEENNGQRGPRGQGGAGGEATQRNREPAAQTQVKVNTDKKDPQVAKTMMSSMTEKSYRFKPAKDGMPKELPAWFTTLLAKDVNHDGQIDMSEFSPPKLWTEAKLTEFNQRDKNGDGLITLEDAESK